jgi:hypothetical protein
VDEVDEEDEEDEEDEVVNGGGIVEGETDRGHLHEQIIHDLNLR